MNVKQIAGLGERDGVSGLRLPMAMLIAVVFGISARTPRTAAQATPPQALDARQADRAVNASGRLDLVDGGSVIGQLLPSNQEGIIRWQAEDFTQPLDFALQSVRFIAMNALIRPQPPADEFACVLRNGNCIYGRLVGLSAEEVELATAAGQRLRIDRQSVERLVRAGPELRSGRRTSIDDPGRSTPWEFDPSGKRWIPAVPARPQREGVLAPAADPFGGGAGKAGNDPFAAPPANAGNNNNNNNNNDPFGGDDPNLRRAELRARQLELRLLRQSDTQTSMGSGDFIDLELGPKSLIELDITWDESPQFNLALGIDHDFDSLKQAMRLAVWDGELVLARNLVLRLNLIRVLSIKELSPENGLQLMIYLDQPAGRVMIRKRSGELLTDVTVPAEELRPGHGVRLLTGEGTRVVRLSAASFSSDYLADVDSAEGPPQVVLHTGQVIKGKVGRLDAAKGTVSVQQQDAEQEIVLSQIRQLILAAPSEQAGVAAVAGDQATPLLHRVVTTDGWYVQGQWLRTDADGLLLQIPGIEDPVRIPLGRLESISSTGPDSQAPNTPSRTGQLVTETAMLRGKVAPSDPLATMRQLLWHPDGSLNPAPLHATVDGEIVYHTLRPPVEAIAGNGRAAPRPAGVLGGALFQIFGPVQVAGEQAQAQPARRVVGPDGIIRIVKQVTIPPVDPSKAALFLRTGDTITCEITQIDERGISFLSPATENGFARHDQVKSVILAGLSQPKQITEATRQRLLMVPRMRRDDPPTHLICSRTGDFLRGRLLGLDAESLRIEVRLETRVIPRDRVAQIFWMHPEPTELAAVEPPLEDEEKLQAAASGSTGSLRMQALRRDGTRMTFDFHACSDGSILVGHHEILGACQVDLLELDRLLLGKAIDRSVENSPLALWRLHDAPIPKAFLPGAGDAEGGTSGTESALVGKPAPEFELELLSGKKFRLADHRGRVVVLDFWASWCGPCIQAMPQIEAVVSDFPETDVQLIAVNLQEQPEAITAALERMGLDLEVALDRNGSVADQYGVTAIPQTVIVGPSGQVARLYVGINASLAKEMQRAITELLQRDEADEKLAE